MLPLSRLTHVALPRSCQRHYLGTTEKQLPVFIAPLLDPLPAIRFAAGRGTEKKAKLFFGRSLLRLTAWNTSRATRNAHNRNVLTAQACRFVLGGYGIMCQKSLG